MTEGGRQRPTGFTAKLEEDGTMRTYIVRRLLILIPTLLLASFVIFFLVRLLPGDIVDVLQAQSTLEVPVDRETR